MPGRNIIVIGASAGGLDAVLELFKELPQGIAASIFLVIHVAPSTPSMLPAILSRRTKFKATHPKHGEEFHPGNIYVAPPDYHMLIKGNQVLLDHGPRENRHRPSIDPLFRSAAMHHGARVIGIILTGSLDDGTAGLKAVKSCGGVAVVQHPEDAQWPSMPESALRSVDVDHCVPISKMAGLLQELIGMPVPKQPPGVDCEQIAAETVVKHKITTLDDMQAEFGPPNGFACPECSGPIWEISQGKHKHFRCLVGHQFSPQSFLEEETNALERALWVAVKALEERVVLLSRLAERSDSIGQHLSSEQFRSRARESEENAETVRRILQKLRS